jgi:hypothetical protein
MNLRVPWKTGHFLTSGATISFLSLRLSPSNGGVSIQWARNPEEGLQGRDCRHAYVQTVSNVCVCWRTTVCVSQLTRHASDCWCLLNSSWLPATSLFIYCVLFHGALNTNITCRLVAWLMNVKGFGKKGVWSNYDTIPQFPCRGWVKLQKSSVRIASVPAETGNRALSEFNSRALSLHLHAPVLTAFKFVYSVI